MQNFYTRFLECVAQYPRAVALEMQHRDHLEAYNYAQLRDMAESIGRWLQGKDYPPGTRCALLAANSPRWVAAYLGVLASGHTAVPLDTTFHAPQIARLLADSGAAVLFTDWKHLGVARQATEHLPVEIVLLDLPPGESIAVPAGVPHLDRMFAAGPGSFTPAALDLQDLAVILYTSGTTSDPKGVMLTHANLLGEIEVVFALIQVGREDAVLGVLPLFHALAQMGNLLLPLVKAARVVYLETLNTTELLRALRDRNITVFCCVPQFFYLIHERITKEMAQRGVGARLGIRLLMRLSRLARALGWNAGKLVFRRVHDLLGRNMRYLITGGSRFDSQVGRDFHALGFDILQAYGLTETSGGAFCTPPGNNVIGSVGPPLPGVEARILDPRPQDAGPEVGEIAICGPIVMKGYYNRPDATAAVLQDGWLRTGDLGYFDKGGNLFITGRQKEVIVLSSGKNIYPEEIEEHYLKSPYIKEICVLGLAGGPGEPLAERLHAVVVPNFELLRQRKIVNTREVIRFDIEGLSVQLPSTKRILSYEIWQEELPRTTTRKLKRFAIEKRVLERQAAGAGEEGLGMPPERQLTPEEQRWLEEPQVRRAMEVVRSASQSKRAAIRPGDNLELDLGLDSMQRVELLVALEDALGGEVDEELASQVYSVRELVDAVMQSTSSGPGKTGQAARPGFAGWKSVLEDAQPPADGEVLSIVQPRPVVTAAWFLFSRLLQLLFRDLFQLRVSGLEKLPARGPFIICPNHQSFFDPVVLGSVLPWQVFSETFSVGTSEIFGSGLMRRLARALRVVVVDPDANLVSAMRAGSYGLRQGKILLLYPEGERSIDGTPKVFKKGAAILAAHLRVPMVPVAMDGFYEAWPRGKPFQKLAALRICFGDPVFPPAGSSDLEAAYEQLTAQLKSRVMEMWTELHQQRSPEKQASAAD